MNVRELGMQIARDQVTAACESAGQVMASPLYEEIVSRLYAFICKVKALEFGAEYYKALLAQVDQVVGGDQEANFANVPGKVMLLAAQVPNLSADAALKAKTDRLRILAKDLRDLDQHKVAP